MPPLRILVLEDNEDDFVLLQVLLNHAHRPTELLRVTNIASLRAALERNGWDLILSDYSMPQLSGLAALWICREAGLSAPFIVLTGALGQEAEVALSRAGANAVVLKDEREKLLPLLDALFPISH